ncbi:MAG TPA: ferritin-like domain-containing protein [Acetobacteraceae bacterium]|nr:ferritin-like domain-containing protein [Acetobacteraceae bacterium]
MKTMNDLFLHFLQDVYYAERQILKALPKMAAASQNAELKQALLHHREETEGHVERLQQVFDKIGKTARGTTCEAIQGLIEEGEDVIHASEPGSVRDAGIAACAQAVEHYEMARYGALIAWAKSCGQPEAAELLHKTLEEEKKADTLLNGLAHKTLNPGAARKAA